MPYVIAAYAVVLGSLTLYGIYLGVERAALRHATGAEPARPVPEGNFGFNVGAALSAPIWLLAHGRLAAGAVLLALIVASAVLGQPLAVALVAAAALAAGVYLGLNGNRIAARHRQLRQRHQLAADQTKWLYLGVIAAYAAYVPLAAWALGRLS